MLPLKMPSVPQLCLHNRTACVVSDSAPTFHQMSCHPLVHLYKTGKITSIRQVSQTQADSHYFRKHISHGRQMYLDCVVVIVRSSSYAPLRISFPSWNGVWPFGTKSEQIGLVSVGRLDMAGTWLKVGPCSPIIGLTGKMYSSTK